MNMFSQMTAVSNSPLQKPATTTTSKAIKESIFWQQQVVNQSNDPAQIERCKAAIAKLTAQLNDAK